MSLRAELERRASAGDRDAARRLGEALRNCDHYRFNSPQEREAQLVDFAARLDGPVTLGRGLQLSPADFVQIQAEELRQLDRVCADFPALQLRYPDDLAEGLRWLERAARAGDTEAMRAYAEQALREYESPDEVLEAADEVRRRRALVLDFLDRAGRLGDADVFVQRAEAFQQGVYGDDPVAVYANFFAYSRSAAGSSGNHLPAAMLGAYAAILTPEQRARAEAAALRWLSPCCGGAGERP